MAGDWTQAEVEATVASYFDMLGKELRGEEYNKAEHRRHLSRLLENRTDGAIERKHQNISAILIEIGFVYISGYKPLRNYQQRLFDVVASRIESQGGLVELVKNQVAEAATVPYVLDILDTQVEPPRSDPKDKRTSSDEGRAQPFPRQKFDYLAMEARNCSLGDAGEAFVVAFETARLSRLGQERLASKIERVSKTRGDGEGFDVLSFEESGQERLIEVKTTAYGPSTPFFVTRNELAVSKKEGVKYHLYRAFHFRRQVALYVKNGPLDAEFTLEPSQFLALVG